MSEAKGVERSVEGVARRLLLVNFASIHSTSQASHDLLSPVMRSYSRCPQTVTQLLYRLLTNPEYLEPLREEVNTAIKEEGWTKAGIDKMHKIDSFLRETQRFDGLTTRPLDPFSTPKYEILIYVPLDVLFILVAMIRLVLRPLKLSNGMTIPAGTLVAIPASATHRDEISYPDPDEFDGFRFAKLREDGGTETSRYQAVSASGEHLAFGLGRHTW